MKTSLFFLKEEKKASHPEIYAHPVQTGGGGLFCLVAQRKMKYKEKLKRKLARLLIQSHLKFQQALAFELVHDIAGGVRDNHLKSPRQ